MPMCKPGKRQRGKQATPSMLRELEGEGKLKKSPRVKIKPGPKPQPLRRPDRLERVHPSTGELPTPPDTGDEAE